MHWLFGIVVAAALAPDPFIPEPPADPAPKQDARDSAPVVPPAGRRVQASTAAHDEIVNLSELDELRAELRALKAENAELKRRVEGLAAADEKALPKRPAPKAAVAKPVRKNYSQIEVGMTRQDVDLFVRTHKNLKLVGVSANSGVTQQAEETVVRREGNSGSTVVRRGGNADSQNLGPGTVNEAQEAVAGEQKERIERRISSGKREVITVAQLVPQKVVTGQQRNSLGGSTPVYGTRWVEGGRLRIEMTNDVVTGIDGVQY